jgi:hypothetical protein
MRPETVILTRELNIPFSQIQQFVVTKLPDLNDAIVAQKSCVYEISQFVKDDLSELVRACPVEQLETKTGLEILRCISPIVSSIQRHLETYNYPNKHFSQLLGEEIENFLLRLGNKTGLPPRDSTYTTWLLNDKPVYTFDQNSGWLFFWKAVRLMNENNLKAFQALDIAANSPAGITSDVVITALNYSTERLHETFLFFKNFLNGSMLPEYFANVFRTYFLSYRIGKKMYTGSNATNLASVPALDYKIGIVNNKYAEVVANRFAHLTIEDIAFVRRSMKEPSIIQLIIEYLGFDYHHFKYSPIEILRQQVNRQLISTQFRRMYSSLLALIKEYSSLSKLHFGLINTFLMKQAVKYESCPAGFSRPAVDFGHGVGGATHEETKQIREMRTNNYLISKLDAILYS